MNFEVAELIADTFISIYMRLVVKRKSNTDFFLPDNIIAEILSRLDTKSLMRFKCVCKSWQSLISQDLVFRDMCLKHKVPYILFGPRHVSRPCLHERIFSYGGFGQVSNLRLPPTLESGNNTSFVVEGSDNGILCLSEYSTNTTIYLWNPTTREVKKLPSPNCSFWRNSMFRVGFGFDPSTNDFKVVRVSRSLYREVLEYNTLELGLFYGSNDNNVLVYSSRSKSWKKIVMSNIFPQSSWKFTYMNYDCFVVVNGSIHWSLVYVEDGVTKFGIVAFDVNTEVFKLIKLPRRIKVTSITSIGKLSELLSFMTQNKPGLVTDIWVMKEYGGSYSWIKQMRINLTNKCSLKWLPQSLLTMKEYDVSNSWTKQLMLKLEKCFLKWSPFLKYCKPTLELSPFRIKKMKLTPIAFGNNGCVLFRSASLGFFCYDPDSNILEWLFNPKLNTVVGFTNYVESAFRLN